MSQISNKSIWNKGFLMVFLANICVQIGQATANTLVPKYVRFMGADATTVGMITGSFAIAALVIRPFAGPTFDVFRKKRILQVTLSIMILSYFLFFVSNSIPTILAGRIVQGFGVGTTFPVLLAFACSKLDEENLSKGVGYFAIGNAFGQAIGPGLGLQLAEKIGYNGAFVFTTAAVILAIVFVTICEADPKPRDTRYVVSFDRIICKEALPVAVLTMLTSTGYATISGFLAIYGGLLNVENIGLYFTVYALLLFVVRPFTAGLADKFGFTRVIVPELLIAVLGFLIIGKASALWMFIAAAVVLSVGYGAVYPTIQALGMSFTPKDKRGVGSNTLYFGTDAGQFLGPALAGAFIDRCINSGVSEISAHAQAFNAMSLTFFIAAVYTLVVIRILEKKRQSK